MEKKCKNRSNSEIYIYNGIKFRSNCFSNTSSSISIITLFSIFYYFLFGGHGLRIDFLLIL